MENPQIRKYLYSKAAYKHIPIGGTFELTPCCNMNCKMCYIRMSKEEQERAGKLRTAKEWLQLGKVCRDSGMLFLLLTGGEPFLRPDFREIYEGLCRMGLLITINTNGTMITGETVEWLKKMPPSKMNVTLYGCSAEAYGELCGYRDGYQRATEAILMLKEAGIHVSINVSFTEENAKEQDRIQAFIAEHDLPARITSYMFPPVRKKETDCPAADCRMTPEKAGYLQWRSEQFRFRGGYWEARKEGVLKGVPEMRGDCPVDEKMQCMAGRSVFWITWDFKLRGCGMMTEPSVKVEAENFTERWKEIGEKIGGFRLPGACSVCEYRKVCAVCGAVVQAEGQGNMEEKPEYLCRLTKEYVRLIKQEKEEDEEE